MLFSGETTLDQNKENIDPNQAVPEVDPQTKENDDMEPKIIGKRQILTTSDLKSQHLLILNHMHIPLLLAGFT